MYILRQYPQISETYIQTEIDAVSSEYEVIVIAFQQSGKNGTATYKEHTPYLVIKDAEQIDNAIRMFRPQVLHTHWQYRCHLYIILRESLVSLLLSVRIPLMRCSARMRVYWGGGKH